MDAMKNWETIDAALIRMRRLLNSPQPREGGDVELSAVLVVDTVARRAREGEPTRIVDIATELSVKPSTASRLTSSTEAAGYIEKSAGPDDSRSVLLHLTANGRRLNAIATQHRLDFLRNAVPGWDAETVVKFARLLDEFSRAASGAPRP